LVRQSKEAEDRLKRLAARLAEAQRQRDSLAAEAVDESTLAAAAGAVAAAEAKTEEARRSADAAEDALSGAEAAEAEAREAAQAAEAAHTRLRTEAQALEQLLAGGADTHKAPVLDQIKVEPGFEAALAAALGDDLSASLDGTAPRHWDGLAPYDSAPQLPPGVAPLATRVAAPAVLARRLAQIGIVSDAAEADRLRAALLPGQRLVTCEGGLWRWDGFVACAGAPTAAAQRLRQRNRLDTLTAALASAKAEADRLKATLEAARMESRRCAEHARAARQSARDTINELGRVRDAQAALAQRATAASSRLTALAETIGLVQAELKEVEAQRTAASEAIRVLPDAALGRDALATLRARVSDKRTAYLSAQSDHDRLVRDAQARVQRLASIGLEERSWDGRAEAAARQRESLDQRRVALEREITALDSRPGEIGAQRETLAETIARATAKRGAAGDALAVAETRLAEAEKAARAAEASLAAEREERVRREAAVSHATEALETLRRRIAERLDCAPEGVLAEAGVGADDPLPTIADAEARVERLTRERDSMGPVNLVAESEAAEVESRVQALEAERADLTAAIARLRQGIGALNREGRERLLAAFAQVNEHFEKLFVRLFGGGGAHLILDEGQDPLEAGLEIMASPPGKRLQTLSLLSGGEQALTAVALIFALFLTNPAPICVLDEVDAPLDDANVDRFCRLVEEIADSATTRFLVITHHRITMARMDRLFGVTMAERGVSQLVSVDLHGAERLRKTA
jgi:chromosome segregation protein